MKFMKKCIRRRWKVNVYELLASIQKNLKAPKNQYNAFGKFKYRSCEDILEAVKPLLQDAVLTINDNIIQIGDRYYVEATASLSIIEDCISTTAYAREEGERKGMDASQITGATSSYARKYALNGLFLIDDTKDADTQDKPKKDEKKEEKKEEKGENPQKKILEGLISHANIDRERFKRWLASVGWLEEHDGKLSLNTLTEERLKNIILKWKDAVESFGKWSE